MLKNLASHLRGFLARIKDRADFAIFALSTAALLLFVVNEVLSITGSNSQTIFGSINLPNLLLRTRMFVWGTLVVHFLSYGIISGNFRQYVKNHLLELLVCIGWFPQYSEGLIRHIHSFFSVEMLQLIGLLANASLVMRFFVKRFRTDPLIVTGAAFILVIVTASGLLMHVEPQTFPNWIDAGWYCIVTITTIGYGDIVPHTLAGRAVGVGLMICGIGLAAALIGIVSQLVQRRLGQHDRPADKLAANDLSAQLTTQLALLERIAAALEQDNQLKAKLLAALEHKGKTESDEKPTG